MNPPYIFGYVLETTDHDQQVLQSNVHDIQDTAIADNTDNQLVAHLCRKRAILSLSHTATGSYIVECLLLL